jgi:hypothetical protein
MNRGTNINVKTKTEEGDRVCLAGSKMNYLLAYSSKKRKVVFQKLQCILLRGK